MMDPLSLLLVGILLLLTGFCFYLKRNHGSLETLGIPVDKPWLIFGSGPYEWHKVAVHEYYVQKAKQYGMTWGRYQGRPGRISFFVVVVDT